MPGFSSPQKQRQGEGRRQAQKTQGRGIAGDETAVAAGSRGRGRRFFDHDFLCGLGWRLDDDDRLGGRFIDFDLADRGVDPHINLGIVLGIAEERKREQQIGK